MRIKKFRAKKEPFFIEIDPHSNYCPINKDKVNCEWRKYGKPLEMDARMRVEREGKVQRLTITGVKMSDKQSVSCVAVKNREEVASTSGKIVVADGPTEIVRGLRDMQVPEGGEALLAVTLNKESEEVGWFVDWEMETLCFYVFYFETVIRTYKTARISVHFRHLLLLSPNFYLSDVLVI